MIADKHKIFFSFYWSKEFVQWGNTEKAIAEAYGCLSCDCHSVVTHAQSKY